MAKGFFITGTDTGVGKTHVAQGFLLAAGSAGVRAVGMKPVASGAVVTPQGLHSEDADTLIRAGNVSAPYADVNPYVFAPAIAPHIAAREAGIDIRLEVIRSAFERLAQRADYVIVEGAGGWLAPVSESHSMADIARSLGLPVVLVVGMRLGCLNHALLTQQAITSSGLALAGWVANCVEPSMERFEANLSTLQRRLHAPLLAAMPFSPDVPHAATEQLKSVFVKVD